MGERMNPSSFHKLRITKCILGNVTLLSGNYFDGLNDPNSPLTGPPGLQPVFEGVLQNSKKYFMYCVNDTTSSRKNNVISLTFDITFSNETTQAVTLNIPANTFVKVHIPLSLITIPSGQTITNTALVTVIPSVGTVLDAFVEAEYQR
jgi:hypothetical protein